MDEVAAIVVGKGGSVVAMDELVDIVVVEDDSIGAIPECMKSHGRYVKSWAVKFCAYQQQTRACGYLSGELIHSL